MDAVEFPTRKPTRLQNYDYSQNGAYFVTVWQRGYYEHVVRCEADFLDILRYIEENPAKWLDDPYYE